MRKLIILFFLISTSFINAQGTIPQGNVTSVVTNPGGYKPAKWQWVPVVSTDYLNPNFPNIGKVRVNSTDSTFEYHNGTVWKDVVKKPKIYAIQNATVSNVRNDSPSIITLSNGNLLCAFSHFGAAGSDISTAYIAGKISTDKGKTWGADFPLQTNISGAINTLGASLYLNESGNIVMVYLVSFNPNPTYKLYKTVFDQNLNVITPAADLGISGNVAAGTDRFYKDASNGKLLLPIYRLQSGSGSSYESIYTGSILVSNDDGATFTDLGFNIGSTKLLPNGFGGATETGVYYTPQGLIAYFRSLLGATYGVKLDSSYNPVGSEFILYSSANAQSSIKWIPSLNMAVAARTRLEKNEPLGDNVRKHLDVLSSLNGTVFTYVDEIDYAIEDTDWYVNMPIVNDIGETVLIAYNNSKTGTKTASLFNKIYPKSFFYPNKYSNTKFVGLSDDGNGGLRNGIQVQNSIDSSNQIVSLNNPLGGSLKTTAGVGAFKITFPNNRNANITITGRVFDETAGNSFSFTISCNTANMANSYSARVDYPEVVRGINVRFVNGTNPKIFIGDLASTWSNPSLIIDKVTATNLAYLNELSEGWKVELETSSYGTVAATVNTATSYTTIRGATFKITNPPGGNETLSFRGVGGYLRALAADVVGYSIYDPTGSTLLHTVKADGNISVEGTPTATKDVTTKGYVDGLNANNIKQGGNSFGAQVNIGSNDNFDVDFRRNGTSQLRLSNGAALFNTTIIGAANDGGLSLIPGSTSVSTSISRNVTTGSLPALIVNNGNNTSTGDIINFSSTVSSTNATRAGVRKDGRVFGQTPTASDDLTTKNYTDNRTGWQQVNGSDYTIGAPLVINAGTNANLANNGAVSNITTQLPSGVTTFVNTTNGKITPQNDGDFYIVDIRFKASSTSPDGVIDIGIDIGGAMGIIRQHTISLRKGIGVEQRVALSFPVYSGATFVANGGSVNVASITGNTSIYDVVFVVDRTHKAK